VTIIVLLAVVAIGAAVGLLSWWITQRSDEPPTHSLPPLLYPLPPSLPPTRANGNGNGTLGSSALGKAAPRRADAPVFRPIAVEPRALNDRRPEVRAHEEEHDDTETVRFVRPSDLSVQLLPGRLEVLEGATPHREIRFLRVPGEPAQLILGREVGLTPHYVGLGSPTVSRRHARLEFTDNRWIVKNLSRTNPLVVNDDELFDTDDARPLADGDRLELGEVVLRFHAQ
jgi:hypothetical protein